MGEHTIYTVCSVEVLTVTSLFIYSMLKTIVDRNIINFILVQLNYRHLRILEKCDKQSCTLMSILR